MFTIFRFSEFHYEVDTSHFNSTNDRSKTKLHAMLHENF